MSKFHTHYDNLKVARNAPDEVIRASYLALSKKFHPDVNQSQDATRIMKIINNSYDVLSDPEKRKTYDFQTYQSETKGRNSENETFRHSSQEHFKKTYYKNENFMARFLSDKPCLGNAIFQLISIFSWLLNLMRRNPQFSLFIVVFCVGWMFSSGRNTSNSIPQSQLYVSSQKMSADDTRSKTAEEQKYKYEKPSAAPNGISWPIKSGYLGGYKKLNQKGKSTIQIENFENVNDFYVKLVDSAKEKTVTVRHALIKGRDEFVFENVSPGNYKLMYMDLDSGYLTKSQEFEVKEIVEEDRVRVSSMKITLYKVRNGNFRSEGIDLDEFLNADTISESKISHDLNPIETSNKRI